MDTNMLLKSIPKIDDLLRRPELASLSPTVAVDLARQTAKEVREGLLSGELRTVPSEADFCRTILMRAEDRPRLRRSSTPPAFRCIRTWAVRVSRNPPPKPPGTRPAAIPIWSTTWTPVAEAPATAG